MKKMTREEVLERYGLCGVCDMRDTCDERPDDIVLTLCSSFADDGGTEYEVVEDETEVAFG